MRPLTTLYALFASLIVLPGAAIAQQPNFSHQAGFYTDSINLIVSCPDEFPTAWVSFNGSNPGPDNPDSEQVSAPIQLSSRAGDPNGISLIPLNNSDAGIPGWLPPTEEIFKSHSISVRCFNSSGEHSETAVRTFFIDEAGFNRYSLPVVSFVSDPDGLFSFETGIKVPGINYVEGENRSGNYFQRGDEWERLMHIEFFEPDGQLGFAQFAGMRIHGNFTRSYPRKSMRLYSRADYGTSRFEYKIFENQPVQRFNRLIFRTSGNDFGRSLFRDVLAHKLYQNTGIETQDYRPVILFLNGEYWGIYNIRERYDRHYFDRVYGVDRENLDYIDFLFNRNPDVSDGSREHYMDMLDYALDNNLAEAEHYEYMQTQMVVDDFINMVVMGIYSSNTDWPRTNVRVWRTRNEFDPEAGPKDGRWRWLLNDIDFGFGLFQNASHNYFGAIMNENWEGELLMSLMDNESFKHSFINRFADHMHSVFNPDFAHSVINNLAAGIDAEVAEHTRRWQYPSNYNSWNNTVNSMKNWLADRPDNIRNQIIERFDLSGTANFSLNINQNNSGVIKLNSIRVSSETDGIGNNPYPFEATYFAGVPVRLEAIPNAGYRFDRWEGVDADGPVVFVDPASITEVTAVFEFEPFDGDEMNPVAWDMADGDFNFNFWDALSPAGSFPSNMVFQQSSITDPELGDEMTSPYHIPEDEYHEDDEDSIGFPYNLTRRTRINGLGDRGISFINTGRNRDLGAAVVALDTRDADALFVSFRAGTELPNSRVYGIRLQYRVGTQASFQDVLMNGEPVEYIRNVEQGHSQFFDSIPLPGEALGHPYVQLRWKYHHIDVNSGPRAELSLGDITVTETGDVSVNEGFGELPVTHKLEQNYPNPFNPTTNISFALPQQADVLVEVFNIAGQRVAVLADANLPAGTHQLQFDGSRLASGLYIYRLSDRSSGVQLTRKMMLLK
ncbi:MAG: CotH kinase family protein [Balneolales bacterium]|nr:CotH kinase family protein [Balneolales bacterium]